MDTKPRILVVEDNASAQEIARIALEPHAVVIISASISAALKELRANPVFCLAILDGRVPCYDNEPLQSGDTTLSLAHLIVEIYKIPAYSASIDDHLNKELAKIGCIHTNKVTAVKEAKKVLVALRK
jgi:CheY-like chemotaxis protein